jgi:hypothetical protein
MNPKSLNMVSSRRGLRRELPEMLRCEKNGGSYHNNEFGHLHCQVAGQTTAFIFTLRSHVMPLLRTPSFNDGLKN